MPRMAIPESPAEWNRVGADYLPGTIGMEIVSVDSDALRARMRVEKRLCASNGYLHAGAVVSFADTCCGYATMHNLPEGADGFTTLELKCNFLGTELEGDIISIATPVHKGRTTQVWDAEVKSERSGKTIARFRCTQMILRSKDKSK